MTTQTTAHTASARRPGGRARGLAVAVAAVAAAFALSLALAPFVRADSAPIFLAAVMVSAWRGGLAAGLVATAFASALRIFFFLPPAYSWRLDARGMEELAVFALAAVIISSLSAAREEALARERAARREAEDAGAVKDEFLAAVSHELRTPLATIKTLTRLLLRDDTTDEERRDYLGDIASECERQIDLVNNLLDVSRIRAGGVPVTPRRADVAEVVAACAKAVRLGAAERGHALVVEAGPDVPAVRADPAALRRAICAVAENAIKYTPDGGTIRISARRDSARRVAVEVTDDGPGMREEDLPRVFESFYRGRPPGGGEVPGVGLGLFLARELVEGMGGAIEAASRPGAGSTFTLFVPVWDDGPWPVEGGVSDGETTAAGR